jgi:hypothetical protein
MIDHPAAHDSGHMTTYPQDTRTSREPRGEGWVLFAGVYLGLAGVLNVIYGIAAQSNKSYFHEGSLIWSNLSTWGWITLALGALQLLSAGLLMTGSSFGAIMAIFFSSLAFIANFLAIGAYPVWSVIAMVLSGFVIWGLTVNMADKP